MSPLQFQKKLRLHEARRLMLAEGLEATTAYQYTALFMEPFAFNARLCNVPLLRPT